MTKQEQTALILAGISARAEQYERVKEIKDRPLYYIEIETGYTRHFITQCRKIAGWKRRKNER